MGATGTLEDYVETNFLKHVLRIASMTSPLKVYLGLATKEEPAPADELSGSGYEREVIEFKAPESDVPTETTTIENCNRVRFPKATADWSTIKSYMIWDAKTGGNFLAEMGRALIINIKKGEEAYIDPNGIDISLTRSGWSEYLHKKFFNHVFRNITFTQPNLYVVLCQTVSFDSTGSGLDEDTARVLHNSWNTPVGNAPAVSDNNGDISWPDDCDYITLQYAILDAASSGNLLFWGATETATEIDCPDWAYIVDASLEVTLD